MNELKPCPFCGGQPEFFANSYNQHGLTRGWNFGIRCQKCNIRLPKDDYKLYVRLSSDGDIITSEDERGIAEEAWNRREKNE